MEKQPRKCIAANHNQQRIEYVCVFPQCLLSRFLCQSCVQQNIHDHKQFDDSHILGINSFYNMMKKKLNQAKIQQQGKKYDLEMSIDPLKQIIKDIQNLMRNVDIITQKVEQGDLLNLNFDYLENQLQNVKEHGFNQIDDLSLNNIIVLDKLDEFLEIHQQLEYQSNLLIQHVLKIKEWRLQLVTHNQIQKIRDAQYQIHQLDDTFDRIICTGIISNDLKYIVSGGSDDLLRIWDYQTNKLIKSIYFDYGIQSSKFTKDSKFLYIGSDEYLFQLYVKNSFKKLSKQFIHKSYINDIYCITNIIILTSSIDKTIIKTNVNLKQKLMKIKADEYQPFDYNSSLNIIATVSNKRSIKLWNGNDGCLFIEKSGAHDQSQIKQVLFIINNNQLISIDEGRNLKIWNLNNYAQQIEELQFIKDFGYNISLVLKQQFIITTDHEFIKVYTNYGQFIRQFKHQVRRIRFFNTIQIDSMKAVLIYGIYQLGVCKLDIK